MGYPNLRAEMARNGIGIKALMEVTGKSRPAVSNNLNGKGHFTVDESVAIKTNLFPALTIDYLFSESPIEACE